MTLLSPTQAPATGLPWTKRVGAEWPRWRQGDTRTRRIIEAGLAPAEALALPLLEANLQAVGEPRFWYSSKVNSQPAMKPEVAERLLHGLDVREAAFPDFIRALRLHTCTLIPAAAEFQAELTLRKLLEPRWRAEKARLPQPRPEPLPPRLGVAEEVKTGRKALSVRPKVAGQTLLDRVRQAAAGRVDWRRPIPGATVDLLAVELGRTPRAVERCLDRLRAEHQRKTRKEREMGAEGLEAEINAALRKKGSSQPAAPEANTGNVVRPSTEVKVQAELEQPEGQPKKHSAPLVLPVPKGLTAAQGQVWEALAALGQDPTAPFLPWEVTQQIAGRLGMPTLKVSAVHGAILNRLKKQDAAQNAEAENTLLQQMQNTTVDAERRAAEKSEAVEPLTDPLANQVAAVLRDAGVPTHDPFCDDDSAGELTLVERVQLLVRQRDEYANELVKQENALTHQFVSDLGEMVEARDAAQAALRELQDRYQKAIGEREELRAAPTRPTAEVIHSGPIRPDLMAAALQVAAGVVSTPCGATLAERREVLAHAARLVDLALQGCVGGRE